MKTYTEWNKIGRRVHKGAKAADFKSSEPLFTEDQTWDYKAKGIQMRQDEHNRQQFSSRLGITGMWDNPPH